jgi:TPR repeat protein
MSAILILADNLRIKNSPEAFNWYCYTAEIKHNPVAMTKLAWIYFGGECGQHPDKERGFKWFKLTYEAGSTAAGRLLAIVTCEVTEQGIRILLPLANAGVAHALTLVGQCHYNVAGPLPIYSARTVS